jgi:hypothetical protein
VIECFSSRVDEREEMIIKSWKEKYFKIHHWSRKKEMRKAYRGFGTVVKDQIFRLL